MNEPVTGITGHLVLIMAPTGSGKGELVRYIFARFPELTYSVSCTTRAPRPGETHGKEYCFIDRPEFEEKIKTGDFLEWAEFGGNLYGTPISEVIDRLQDGQVVISEIELQGVEALKRLIPEAHLTIVYIEAGGWEVLKERALRRAPISDEELEKRRQHYLEESGFKKYADYVIHNYDGELEKAKQEFEEIIGNIIKQTKHDT